MQEQYNAMWQAYQRGEISQEVWLAFANEVFEQLLVEIEDSFIKLKNI